MFVYKKGRLIQTNTAVKNSPNEAVFKLFHPSSGMAIEVTYSTDTQSKLNSPFRVYKEENGQYVIFEEFYQDKRSLVATFEEAINFFESQIYELLNEKPPKVNAPKPQPSDTFQEPPIVGDIIRVDQQFSIVTDVKDNKITAKKLTKKEAMKMLRNKRNAELMQQSEKDDENIMAKGGEVSKNKGGFVEYDNEKDRIIILRSNVAPPPPPQGEDEEADPPEPNDEPTPDNIEDPFQDGDMENEDDVEKKEKDSKPTDSKDGKEDNDADKKDPDGKDKSDGDKDGDNDGEKGERADEDDDGLYDDDENYDWEDEDGEQKGASVDSDDEFGDDVEVQDIEDMIKNISSEADSDSVISAGEDNDLNQLELFLGMKQDQIKSRFKTKAFTKKALGSAVIFDNKNKSRIEKTLNEIFK